MATKIKVGALTEEGDKGQQGKDEVQQKDPKSIKVWVEGTFKKQYKNKEAATTDRVSATKEPNTTDERDAQRD